MKKVVLLTMFLGIGWGSFAQQPQTTDSPLVHDPVMAKQGDTYYLFATGEGVSVMSSKDLKTWKFEKPVFAEAPQWAVEAVKGYKGHTWAPDIIYHNGQYHLFYSCSAFAKTPRLSDTRRIPPSTLPTRILSGPTTEK